MWAYDLNQIPPVLLFAGAATLLILAGFMVGLVAGRWGRTGLKQRAVALEEQLAEATAGAQADRQALMQGREENVRLQAREQSLSERVHLLEQVREQKGRLEAQASALTARIEERERAVQQERALLEERFGKLAGEVLQNSQKGLLDLAKQNFDAQQTQAKADLAKLVQPVAGDLAKLSEHIGAVEKARNEAYGGLRSELKSLVAAQGQVAREAQRLATALKDGSGVRGRWGEQQLERIFELAGMSSYVDFDTQVTVRAADGRQAKPDAIIRLPGERAIIVDAKAPMSAYIEARNEVDEQRRLDLFQQHARQVRVQMQALAAKAYAANLDGALDSVVMFLPTEDLASAAWDHDASLYDDAFRNRVLIATPTTLFALAKAVAHVWRNEKSARNAHEVARLGAELHERISTMAGHIRKLGGALDNSAKHYNAFLGSLERKVLPKAREFKALEIVPADADDLDVAASDERVRGTMAPELRTDHILPAAE